jgi:menaquinone-9 beta-reductase
MDNDYDVIIIGSGPAGISCAKSLVENKIKTLVIERKKLPREKCCSGLLSDRALNFIQKSFGDIPDNIFCKNKNIHFRFSISGIKYRPVPNYNFQHVYRDIFDYWLLKESNVEYMDECNFLQFKHDGKFIIITAKKGNEIFEFKTKYLIGADGANSIIRKKIDPNYNKKTNCTVVQKIYKGNFSFIDDSIYYLSLNRKYSDKNFAWFTKKDDLIYIGTSWVEKLSDYYNIWLEYLTGKYKPELELIKTEACNIEIFNDIENLYFGQDNIIIAGEATGLISLFGEGIPSALISGNKCAEAILSSNNDKIEEYKKLLDDEINFVKNACLNPQLVANENNA